MKSSSYENARLTLINQVKSLLVAAYPEVMVFVFHDVIDVSRP
jgi:hypothetical protein